MKKCLIIGGSNGIGQALCQNLLNSYNHITIVDIVEPKISDSKISYIYFDLFKNDINELKDVIIDTDDLIITAGIGRVNYFQRFDNLEIKKTYQIDLVNTALIIRTFYENLLKKECHHCMVFGSIAGDIASPLFSIYGSAKAGINKLCESLNTELMKQNSSNRITLVSPTSFKGSSFNGGTTNLDELENLSNDCISAMRNKAEKFFPDYDLYQNIYKRYIEDSAGFSESSYEYKIQNKRLSDRKMYKIGYLSGTFDLFHVGHLNLIKKAKSKCDYLIVGVHKDASHKGKETVISFDNRKEIVAACKYVDKVVDSTPEDSDAWSLYHYDYLFVGSDYKGTDRFIKYEKFFKDKGVEIIYFPYTTGISSTDLRITLSKKAKK